MNVALKRALAEMHLNLFTYHMEVAVAQSAANGDPHAKKPTPGVLATALAAVGSWNAYQALAIHVE